MPRLSRSFLTTAATAALVGSVLLGGGVAWAAWSVFGTGEGTAAADSLVAPVASATRSTTAPTSEIIVSWTAAGQLPGATYSVTRNGTVISCATSPCTDSGLASGADYTYAVTPRLSSWSGIAGFASASTQAAAVGASSYAVSVSSPLTAGAAAQVTITAMRPDGTTDTGFTGARSVSLTGSATATSPARKDPTLATSATFTNGVAVVDATFVTAGSGLGLTATTGSLSGSTTLDVNAAAASNLGFSAAVVKNSGGTVVANNCLFSCTVSGLGSPATIETKVGVFDSFGNLAAPVGSSITVSTSASNGASRTPASLVIAAGSSTSSSTVTMTSGAANNAVLTLTASPYAQVQATLQKN